MLLPLFFLAWLWGHAGLSVKAGPKLGHQATALVKIALVYLALVYTLATTLVVALPTPVVHDIDVFAKAIHSVINPAPVVRGDIRLGAELSASKRQDNDPTKYCVTHPSYRECLPNHTPGSGGCQLYPSRKCPPPPPKKGSNPGGGGPGHNATAQDLIATQGLAAATSVAAAGGLTTGVKDSFEQGATHRKPDIPSSVKIDEAANVQPSASLSGTTQAEAALASVEPTLLKEDEGGEGCVWVGNVRKCGRKYGPIVQPCEQYPSRKCPPAKKKGGSPGGGPGHNATATQDLPAAQKLTTAEDVAAAKGYTTAQDLTAKGLDAATVDSTRGSGGAQLHHSVAKEPGTHKADLDGATAPEFTMAESLVEARLDKPSLLERAFACFCLQEKVKPAAMTTVVVQKEGRSVVKAKELSSGDEEHH